VFSFSSPFVLSNKHLFKHVYEVVFVVYIYIEREYNSLISFS